MISGNALEVMKAAMVEGRAAARCRVANADTMTTQLMSNPFPWRIIYTHSTDGYT